MSTALVGDFPIGVQPLWPPSPVTLADVFDSPSWERPTPETGYTPPEGTAETFEGVPGFGGGPDGGGVFTGSPGFTGEAYDGSFWSMGDASDPDDGGTITVVQLDGTVVSMAIRANRLRHWRIEVRDPDGDLLAHVPEWIGGKLRRMLDKASALEFRIEYDAEGADELARPNTVWLRDRWGYVVDTFQIMRRRPVGRGDSSFIDIVCQGAISQLAMEVVIEYAEDDPAATVGQHVAALLALQGRDDALTLGRIDPEIEEIELPFFAYDTTIHAALLQLQIALPRELRGRFYVDARRRLQWRLLPGDTTEQIITRGRNVYAIEAETDYSTLVNRLYMYGEGQDTRDRLKLTALGEEYPEEYLDDTESITAYGLAPAIKVDRRIRYPETLLRVAQRILEEFAAPQVVVRVDLLDLAKADDAPAGWRDIEIGGKYRAVDTTLGIDSVVEIVEIETDLARPVPIRVELANQTKTLGDLVSALIDATQQPLDVDGDRYPTMGRNYTSREPREARAGDVRWNADDDRGEMHDGDAWQAIASEGAIYWYTATTKAGLPNTDIPETALGRVTAGDDKGMVCVRNPDNNGWDAINFME